MNLYVAGETSSQVPAEGSMNYMYAYARALHAETLPANLQQGGEYSDLYWHPSQEEEELWQQLERLKLKFFDNNELE